VPREHLFPSKSGETVPEEHPVDPERPRKVPRIKQNEAKIVVRVFHLYDDGLSMKRIAHLLNAEGVPSPSGGTRWRAKRKGWSLASVHHVLHNERYAGVIRWNTHEWIKDPKTGKRLRRRRPESEWVTKEAPELRIVPEALWKRVAAKLAEHEARGHGARGLAVNQTERLFTGLLRCGTCGGAFNIRGTRIKNGVRYPSYACTTHYNRGPAVCPNGFQISEGKLTEGIIGAVQNILSDPTYVDAVVAGFERRMSTPEPEAKSAETKEVDALIAACQQRIANLTDALAARQSSQALLDRLDAEERQLVALRERRAATLPKPAKSKPGPDRKQVEAMLATLADQFGKEPAKSRAVLAKHVGPVKLTPKTEGPRRIYVAEGAFNLLAEIDGVRASSGSGGAQGEVTRTGVRKWTALLALLMNKRE
jgi:hypothetical protein